MDTVRRKGNAVGARPTYTLTLTPEQAQVLSHAAEIIARLGIGQFRDALEWLPTTEFRPDGWHEDMETIGMLLSRHMKHNVDGYRSNLGINNKDVAEQARIAWDLYQVIRHRLSWDRAIEQGIVQPGEPRKWLQMDSVNYDAPMKASTEPLARMEMASE